MASRSIIIPKSQLKHGAYYRGRCRNATVARWNGEDQKFYYWREKFGQTYVVSIRHIEDDNVFDAFNAFEEITNPAKEILFNQ